MTDNEAMPKEVATEYVEMLGKRFKVAVLDDGRRVFEMSDELVHLMSMLGIEVVTEAP